MKLGSIKVMAYASLVVLLAACPRGGVGVEAPKTFVPGNATMYGLVDVAALARNPLLQDELLASYRDRLLKRLGVGVNDALSATGPAEVFGLSETVVGAFVPGLAVQGSTARTHRGQTVVALGDTGLEGARVPGGSVVGRATAVSAALDVAYGGAAPLGASTLRTLVAEAPEFRTIRVATLAPAQLFALLPNGPPANIALQLTTAAAYVTFEDTVLSTRIAAVARDPGAAQTLAAWADGERKNFRATLAGWRETAGIFGGALDPAVAALDAIRVEARGQATWIVTHQDLKPIFSSGLMMVLRTLKAFGN